MSLRIPSFRDINKVVLGLVSLVIVGGMVGGAFAIGTLKLFEDRYAMSGVFSDSGGLKNGAPVRVAGINVGEVTNVAPDYQLGQIIITWEVDSGVHVGPDTRAEIGTATLLGGDYMRLSNTEGGSSYQDLPADERRVPLERTGAPYTVINALSDATRNFNQFDVDAVNNVIQQIGDTIKANQATLPDVVGNLEKLGLAVQARQDQLDALIANGQQVTATLASRDQQLGGLIDQAGALLDALNGRRQQLSELLGSGNQVVNQMADVIEGKRAEIDAILSDLHTTLGAVQRQMPNLNTGLAWAGPTFNELVKVQTGNSFNTAIIGIGPFSLNVLNDFLDELIGPRP